MEKFVSVSRSVMVSDDREHGFIAGDVRIGASLHDRLDGGILAQQEVALSWSEAWEVYDALRYLLNDDEVKQEMTSSGYRAPYGIAR